MACPSGCIRSDEETTAQILVALKQQGVMAAPSPPQAHAAPWGPVAEPGYSRGSIFLQRRHPGGAQFPQSEGQGKREWNVAVQPFSASSGRITAALLAFHWAKQLSLVHA